MAINNIKKVNATVQGTGVSLEKSSEDIPDKIVNEVGYADNLFKDFSDPDPEKSRDFESIIHCCDRIPYMDVTDGIEGADSSGENFPILSTCVDKYEYIHPCGCPQVFIWEYNRGGSLINVYHEADGQSNFKANGSPDSHPDFNGSNAATDSMFGQSGASGFYSLGQQGDEQTETHFGKYALRCDNLHIKCEYVVCVLFTMEDPDTNNGNTFHGGAHIMRFTADSCVQYLGAGVTVAENGQVTVTHTGEDPHPRLFPDDGTASTQLIDFPSAIGGDDAYVNIKSLHIQMTGVPKGRSQSSVSFQENNRNAGCAQ